MRQIDSDVWKTPGKREQNGIGFTQQESVNDLPAMRVSSRPCTREDMSVLFATARLRGAGKQLRRSRSHDRAAMYDVINRRSCFGTGLVLPLVPAQFSYRSQVSNARAPSATSTFPAFLQRKAPFPNQ